MRSDSLPFREDLKLHVLQSKLITSSKRSDVDQYDNDSEYESSIEDEELPDNETPNPKENAYNIAEDVAFHVKCLVELVPSIEQSLLCAMGSRHQSSMTIPESFHVSDPAWAYVSAVREKFKEAQTQLVERLGEANWQRHVTVRRRMDLISEHDFKFINNLDAARSLFKRSSAFHDSGVGTTIGSQTQYAQSHTSFISSNAGGESGSIRPPPTPAEVSVGKPFRCHICGETLSRIKNRVDWK